MRHRDGSVGETRISSGSDRWLVHGNIEFGHMKYVDSFMFRADSSFLIGLNVFAVPFDLQSKLSASRVNIAAFFPPNGRGDGP